MLLDTKWSVDSPEDDDISTDACYVIISLPSSLKQLWRFSRRFFVKNNFTLSKSEFGSTHREFG